MPIRFRKAFNILPGVRVNVSKHGLSTTVGPRGMHLTFNRYGVRQDLGLPGTGLSESSYIVGGNRGGQSAEEEARRHVQSIHHGEGVGCHLPGCGCLLMLVVIAGVLVYLGADALNLHPAAYLLGLLNSLLH
jgi:hypothetical protein